MTNVHPLGHRTDGELRSQPEMWRQALALADRVEGLPNSGERVLILGCGTSYYVGVAYAVLRESAGQGVTDAVIASEILPTFRPYDRAIAISRSGTSSELLDAVSAFREQQPGIPVTALLGEQDTPLARLADHVVDLSFARLCSKRRAVIERPSCRCCRASRPRRNWPSTGQSPSWIRDRWSCSATAGAPRLPRRQP